MMKIGIYGGTFDPVHHAHLILAREAAEQFDLTSIIFVPAAVSPDKAAPFASAQARLQMLHAALARETLFTVDECELRRPAPSYTIDTIEQLREKSPGAELFLLVGDDNLLGLPRWRRFEELRRLVTFIILPRAKEKVTHEYLRVNRRIDISATEIRARIAAGKSIRYLVPAEVAKIVEEQQLYQEAAR